MLPTSSLPFGQYQGSKVVDETVTFELAQEVISHGVLLFCLFKQPIRCQEDWVSSRVCTCRSLALP